MSERTTPADLQMLCNTINEVMKKLGRKAGYEIEWAYGRPRLEQLIDEPAGSLSVRDVSPRLKPGEMKLWLYAFLDGVSAGTLIDSPVCINYNVKK